MLAPHAPSLSLHPTSAMITKPSLLSNSRPALADSTNINSHSHVGDLCYSKALVYPTSPARTSCGWGDVESLASFHSRHHHWSYSNLFPVSQKAPPTVSISLSAVCSQSTPGERFGGSQVRGLEPDLPDVKSVVPFPSTPSNGDTDVDMLDGTCAARPNDHPPLVPRAPRKRRSAHSSVSSSQGSLGKEAKQKRPRKSRQHVAELTWLGIVHRSILRSIEARQSIGDPGTSANLLPGRHDFHALDCLLVEKIQKRLSENDCAEGWVSPNPLPRISSPSISVPSLNLADPCAFPTELNPKESNLLQPASKGCPCTSRSHSITPSSSSTSHRPHVRFENPPRTRQSHLTIPRRSPSPQARTRTALASTQTLTLTIPQLVASLTLAYRDRSRPRTRGRSHNVTVHGKNAGHSPSSAPYRIVQRCDADPIRDKERARRSPTPRARTPCTAERKSPLSRVAYVGS